MRTVWVGYDPRQPLAYNVLQQSIHRHASKPVAVIPLQLRQLPIKRRGLTDFTFSRFLVPWLGDYLGSSIFMDADIVVTGDINELFDAADMAYDVQVMQEQPRFEWPSVMLFNNPRCRKLTPEFVDDVANPLFDFCWAKAVGTFPAEWNHCAGYMEPKKAKLYHYTQGIPVWYETKGLPEDAHWNAEAKELTRSCSWKELMGNSVHVKPTIERLVRRLTSAD